MPKNGESQNFYKLEDLQAFLDGLHDHSLAMEMTPQTPPGHPGLTLRSWHPNRKEDSPLRPGETRGRDLDRLTKTYDDRGQVLQAVAIYTQTSDRDKSRSPLKPTAAPT
ncbi:hypothetical protein NDU88_001217 [Pleurodeles waltl]|uniref:Uncharacterized protein n=1 Tax=Pleurodeles waltl TaxID=8319 RepID=A0AAV7Q692_PLEWA|nr:hypothetical protein NDU88_001217 [Pleurodeles waltl]